MAMRTLFVASSGGHITELFALAPRLLPACDHCLWVAPRTPQTESLLAGRDHILVRDVPPRGLGQALHTLPEATRLLREHRIDRVVSTGAAIAVPYFLAAARLDIQRHYIESAARVTGLSLTGRMVRLIPDTHVYTQYEAWQNDGVRFIGSVFDGYEIARRPVSAIPCRIVLLLGTNPYSFRRAVVALRERLDDLGLSPQDVLWQTGRTDVQGLDIDAVTLAPVHEIRAAVERADLVVAHAGVGSARMALDAGLAPVLLPRKSSHGEHVDDHQQLIADALASRHLAVTRDPDDLCAEDLLQAAASRVIVNYAASPIRLAS